MTEYKKKLIEVALPLEAINQPASREEVNSGKPIDAASLVGAPAAGALPGGALRFARRRPVLAPRPLPDRGPAGEGAPAPLSHRRGPSQVGEPDQRGGAVLPHARRSTLHRRQAAAGPRPVLRRWLDSARGSAPRSRGTRQRPQSGRRADHQGAHRDSTTFADNRPSTRAPRLDSVPAAGRGAQGLAEDVRYYGSGCANEAASASDTSTPRSISRLSTAAGSSQSSLGCGRER